MEDLFLMFVRFGGFSKVLLDSPVVGLVCSPLPIEQPGPGVDPGVDDERPEVLHEEHRDPSHLRAPVLEVQHALVLQPHGLEGGLILERLALGLLAQLHAVDVLELLLLGADALLHVGDGVALGHLQDTQVITVPENNVFNRS